MSEFWAWETFCVDIHHSCVTMGVHAVLCRIPLPLNELCLICPVWRCPQLTARDYSSHLFVFRICQLFCQHMTRSGCMCEEVNLQSQDEFVFASGGAQPKACAFLLKPEWYFPSTKELSSVSYSALVWIIHTSITEEFVLGDGVSTSHGIIRTRNFCNLFGKLSLSIAVHLWTSRFLQSWSKYSSTCYIWLVIIWHT